MKGVDGGNGSDEGDGGDRVTGVMGVAKVMGNITKSFKKIATKCSQQTFLNNVKQNA